jgi:hypothetical protein
MKISFNERPIHRAPLEVLNHLYYYTVQYGLSVKQFTGANPQYWADLPKRIRESLNSQAQLLDIINELDTFANGAEERRNKRQAQKDKSWAEKEIVINAQLMSVIASLPVELIAMGFSELTGFEGIPDSLRIVDLKITNDDGSNTQPFVEPDMPLLGAEHLMMVELKTRGGAKSSRKYPPQQLLNYFRLAVECNKSNNDSLPATFSHLILVPSRDPKWIEKHGSWIKSIDSEPDGRVIVDLDACIRLANKNSSFNNDTIRPILKEVPVYYRSWSQLYGSFDRAVTAYNDTKNERHWRNIISEIGDLSRIAGRFK